MSVQSGLRTCEKCGVPLSRTALAPGAKGAESGGKETYWGRDEYGIFILCPEESCRHRNRVSFEEKSQCLGCCNDLIQPQELRPGEAVRFTAPGLEGETLYFKCPSCGKRNVVEEGRRGLRVIRLLD